MNAKIHIATGQYEFLELEGDQTDIPEMIKAQQTYGEKPMSVSSGVTVRLTDFFGNEIDYDVQNHVYSWKGEVYLSGSQYAKQFEKPFDKDKISAAMAKRDGIDPQTLLDQWELNGEVSRGFGTALHGALELFGKYGKLHDYPFIKDAVQRFYEAHTEKAEYEVLIIDHAKKHAGRIDRLVILGDKLGRVEDYKTNSELKEDKLNVYWKQLEFYGGILVANGWKVAPPVIHHFNGSWKEYKK